MSNVLWRKQLVKAGYPTDVLIIDFETFFSADYSLGNRMTTIDYVTDPRFSFTGVGWVEIGRYKPKFLGGDDVEPAIKWMKVRHGKGLHNVTVVAKNCKFDMLILAEKFGIYPPFVLDIDDLLRYYDSRMSHKMKDVAPMFGFQEKGDTNQFKGLTWHEMSTERRQNMAEYCKNDIDIEQGLFTKLLPIIDDPAFELPLMSHTLGLYTKPMMVLDRDRANSIANDMAKEEVLELEKVRHLCEPGANVKKVLAGTKKFPELLKKHLGDEELPMKMGKKGPIPALAQADEGRRILLGHKNPNVRTLMEARIAIKSWPLHRGRIAKLIASADRSNGKVRIPLKYCGAHTARWSGTEKVNPQNLGGKGRGKAVHPLISAVRCCIMAPEFYTLCIADSAQIEARFLAWLAGQTDLVEGFARGDDIYSTFAEELFGHRVWKPASDDDSPEAKQAAIERGFGKDGILGCGYGMGDKTFYDRCRQNDSIRKLFDDGVFDKAFIKYLIKTYRTTYSKIPELWGIVEKAFKHVTKYPGHVATYSDTGYEVFNSMAESFSAHKRVSLTFSRHGDLTFITLPSGRRLRYRHATVNRRGDIRYHWGPLWGGSLVENIVQAGSRDLLAYWLLRCENHGIPIVLHSHDELVACVRHKGASIHVEQILNKIFEIMVTKPDWAEGLPLAVEGEITERYKK